MKKSHYKFCLRIICVEVLFYFYFLFCFAQLKIPYNFKLPLFLRNNENNLKFISH